jgi:glycosyltransferase involved in cell wall biosynthesis
MTRSAEDIRGRGRARDGRRTAVFLIGNHALPRDRRVWQECRTVRAFGHRVIGVSPMGSLPGTDRPFDEVEDIPIHRFPLSPSGGGVASYGREFGEALWRGARVLRRLAEQEHVDVVHAGNPPDFLLLAALPLKRRGTRLIFDHHDLSPEMYLARSGRKDPVYHALRGLERVTFQAADVVIATNDSFRDVAIQRGGKRPEDVFVVRNGPDLSRFRSVEPVPRLRRGKRHLLAYAGVMGRHDGIDLAVQALAALRRRREDWHAVLAGDGEMLGEARELARRLGVSDAVEFPGWLPQDRVLEILSTADVCLAPDPPTVANDRSTMIKVMEYMALGRPIVSFGLPESRVSAGAAARFASGASVEDFARHVDELLDDPESREAMGRVGRERVRQGLSWEHSERALGRAYERALSGGMRDGAAVRAR